MSDDQSIMTFPKAAIDYFQHEVGSGVVQRIDGVEAFSPLSKYLFWKIRLNLLVRRGLLVKRTFHSIWASCRGMPWYGIALQKDSKQ